MNSKSVEAGRTAERATQQSLVLVLLVFVCSLTWVLRPPEFSAFIISVFSRFLQLFDLNTHFDGGFLLRNQIELLQNLFAQMLAKGDWFSIEMRPRPIPFGMKIRFVLVAATTDISVIIPTLNEEKYLRRCLVSLRHQSFNGDYEVLVVDGGSTDRTEGIARDFADLVIAAGKVPVGAARNEGARRADGKVVAFIDADTIAAENWLSSIQAVFEDRGVIAVTGPTLPYDGEILDTITYRLWTIYLQRILLSIGMPHVIGFNCAYRKSSFLRVGGFDETSVMSEDIRLALKMRRFGRIAFEKNMSALTSPRRFRKYGHAYIAGLYVLNGFSTLLFNRSSSRYPPVS
jgi:cellulose synthase/poly-beta-1,6-N-acetylglucosamine synthase-like glycosyltransferase